MQNGEIQSSLGLCPRLTVWPVSHRVTNHHRSISVNCALPDSCAGLRIGYAIADPEWIDKADQVRVHFGVNNLSNHLAERVLDSPRFSEALIAETIALRGELSAALKRRRLDALPSATNFVAIRYPTPEEAGARQKVQAHSPRTHPSNHAPLSRTAARAEGRSQALGSDLLGPLPLLTSPPTPPPPPHGSGCGRTARPCTDRRTRRCGTCCG